MLLDVPLSNLAMSEVYVMEFGRALLQMVPLTKLIKQIRTKKGLELEEEEAQVPKEIDEVITQMWGLSSLMPLLFIYFFMEPLIMPTSAAA